MLLHVLLVVTLSLHFIGLVKPVCVANAVKMSQHCNAPVYFLLPCRLQTFHEFLLVVRFLVVFVNFQFDMCCRLSWQPITF